jgi:hypothetical protein
MDVCKTKRTNGRKGRRSVDATEESRVVDV